MHYFLLTLVFLVLETAGACSLFLAPSTIAGAGFGVFTGKDFTAETVLSDAACVSVPAGSLFGTQLHHFGFRHGFGAAEICFGVAMLCNHADDPAPNVELRWTGGDVGGASIVSKWDLQAEAELLMDYGGASWFSSRNISMSEQQNHGSPNVSSHLKEYQERMCLSDVYIAESVLEGAGRGVFSRTPVVAGSSILISPVVFLPKKRFLRSALSGYLLSNPEEDIAMLPLSLGALVNHAPSVAVADLPDGKRSNARICWSRPMFFDPPEDSACDYIPDFLNDNQRTKLDLIKNHQAEFIISYVATRDIAAGEELYIDYGAQFDVHGRNKAVLLRGSGGFESSASPIDLSPGMFRQAFHKAPLVDPFREEALAALAEAGGVAALKDLLANALTKSTATVGEASLTERGMKGRKGSSGIEL